jgi:hypothetical protein
MLCGHCGRETDQNCVAVEVYNNGKRSAANQQKNAATVEKIARKCVAAGIYGVGNALTRQKRRQKSMSRQDLASECVRN